MASAPGERENPIEDGVGGLPLGPDPHIEKAPR